jgi:CheY-like chemotaxis protein
MNEHMTILVVDDVEINRKLLRATLAAKGHTTVEAADGVEALRVLGRERVDAVVSDILMPNMDGYRFCHEVRQDEKYKTLPFIVYTSTYTSPSDQRLASTVGADGYLMKPAPVEEILRAIDDALRDRNQHGPPKTAADELYVMKEYSEVLVRKLEEKNTELGGALGELQQSNKRIVEINASLERKVYRRTADLFLTNQKLEGEIHTRTLLQEKHEQLIRELQEALANIKTLSGLLPICAWCKKIRDDKGYWKQVEEFIMLHTDTQFSHGICPDCVKKVHPNYERA